jgi:ubiquinone biosynthesis protein
MEVESDREDEGWVITATCMKGPAPSSRTTRHGSVCDMAARPVPPMTTRRDRSREIVSTLSRHGLGYVVGRVHRHAGAPTPPEHVRLALEKLGPTFIKLGQLLSTRSDLLPAEYLAELAKLQDAAPPVPAEVVRGILTDELGRDPSDVFASYEPEPLAAASIGQAHSATLQEGTEVVVKVRRPGVVERVEQDLDILQDLAAHAERHSKTAAEVGAIDLVEEFARRLRSELDYLAEGRSADRFAVNFDDDEEVHIPHVYWETSTSRVLTLERIRGIKISDVTALDTAGIDRPALARRATRITAQMIFDDGLFHADPHPGNFFVGDDGQIGVIDFGLVGELDEGTRDRLGAVLIAVAEHDADELTAALLRLGIAPQGVDRATLRAELAALLDRYVDARLADLSLARLIDEAATIMRRHRLHLPHDLALLAKVLVVDEGLAAQLDPGYRLTEGITPFAQELIARERSPDALVRRLALAGADAAQLGTELPATLRRLLRAAEAGETQVRIVSPELDKLGTRVERAGNTVALALLAVGAFQAGATLLVAARRGRRRRQGPQR